MLNEHDKNGESNLHGMTQIQTKIPTLNYWQYSNQRVETKGF